MLSIQTELINSIKKNQNRNAFYIGEIFYTYAQLNFVVDNIRNAIKNTSRIENKHIGLLIYDDIETYASILACWLEGKAYIPINPYSPIDRNKNVLKQSEIGIVLTSHTVKGYSGFKKINTSLLPSPNLVDNNGDYKNHNSDLAYIFYTSGTTGKPKGVPITFSNLISFCKAFDAMECTMTEEDRCLQMFDLTFDLSVMSYLIPLLKGACVYTIPKDAIKYSYIFELMEEQKLTFSLMVPSMLHYLRPYFEEIHCPDMKYSLFCGEALPLNVTEEWADCIPNAKIMNVYGPTEDTIFCTELTYQRNLPNKTYNGVLSIGKPMKGAYTIIVDNSNAIVPQGKKGELCLAGEQLTKGYWKDPKKNKTSFFTIEYNNTLTRFYRTGDLCFIDEDGDIMYSGRVDFQAKIQGYRVELSEVELYAKEGLHKMNAVAITFTNGIGNLEIGLVIEGAKINTTPLLDHMKSKMPSYMIPTKIKFIASFPLNSNGKIDRNKLSTLFIENKILNEM